jgi:hypothetical protein
MQHDGVERKVGLDLDQPINIAMYIAVYLARYCNIDNTRTCTRVHVYVHVYSQYSSTRTCTFSCRNIQYCNMYHQNTGNCTGSPIIGLRSMVGGNFFGFKGQDPDPPDAAGGEAPNGAIFGANRFSYDCFLVPPRVIYLNFEVDNYRARRQFSTGMRISGSSFQFQGSPLVHPDRRVESCTTAWSLGAGDFFGGSNTIS